MRALVTGGGGFLGGAIVRKLLARGDAVVSLARGDYPALREAGVETHRGDIADLEAVTRAARGCEVLFHVAAKAGVWGPREAYERANVHGTRNVIAACQALCVPRLVYTSTPSVVHAGGDIEGADETLPYPDHFATHYPRTKAEAERAVLAANGPALSTVALRPHLVWGPDDNNLVPRIVDRGRSGRLRFVGPPKRVDTVYVDNAADAHLLAADRLGPDAACAGRAYFVSNDEPRTLDEMVNGILAAAGVPPVSRRISPRLAYAVGALLEAIYGLLRLKREPMMTRFVAEQLSTAHWYDIGAARRDLGYAPQVSIDEGLERLRRWFADRESRTTA